MRLCPRGCLRALAGPCGDPITGTAVVLVPNRWFWGLPWWFLCQISGYLGLRPLLEPPPAAGRVLSQEEQLRSPSQAKYQARIGAVGPVSVH